MKDQAENKNSRRKFLVKTSAVSLISALPATSVWGACTVSGALSGGSKVNDDCTTIWLTNGRSPGFWHDADTKTQGGAIASVFPYLNDYSGTRYDCEKAHLMTVIGNAKNVNIDLGKDGNGSQFSVNIKDALQSPGGITWNLAAVYLNAEFGLYSLLPVTLSSGDKITNGAELIKHLFALDAINPSGEDDTYFGFTNGDTSYVASASGCY
jgi:hypothetical protein